MRNLLGAMTLVVCCVSGSSVRATTPEERLGALLYFDSKLSNPPGQSCASCHHPMAGFADPDQELPVSEGVIPGRFGGRNSPTSAYAAFSPTFYFDEFDGLFKGGQFWDGRAATLEDQAKGPFLNPLEMNNTKDGVIRAVRRSAYASLFKSVYGKKSLDNVDTAYDRVAKAIAAFERTKLLNSFSSKYDYVLKGKAKLTLQEARGLALFNSKGNCAACHPSDSADGVTPALFTDFSYDNLGIPPNTEYPFAIDLPPDLGLGVTVNDPAENGKFKVPTLRNVAVTGPWGHNGYFETLKDIVHFYNTRDVEGWPLPDVPETVNVDELGDLGLTSQEEDDVVAFLKTLTDGHVCGR
jgi:cytochrome c peroxidase